MEHENDKERADVPYDMPASERLLAARQLRRQLCEKLGGFDTVSRFIPRGGRVKMQLPFGEDLLRHADFSVVGVFGGVTIVRATVDIPFESEPNAPYFNDPYRETVELCIGGTADADAPAGVRPLNEAETAQANALQAQADAEARILRRRAKIYLAIALAAGLVSSETLFGALSWTKKKLGEWHERVTTPALPEQASPANPYPQPYVPPSNPFNGLR